MSNSTQKSWTAPEVFLLRSAQSAETGGVQESGETAEKTNFSTLISGNV